MLLQDIKALKGVGPKRSEILLQEAGISTIEDLLYYSPRRYIDRSTFKNIKDCLVNDEVTIRGTVESVEIHQRKKKFLEVIISDESDHLSGIFFGGAQYLEKKFNIGDEVLFSGKITFFRNKQMTHPAIDFLNSKDVINTGRIIPLYPSTEKLKEHYFDSRGFRTIINDALKLSENHIEDPIPQNILNTYNLMPLADAISNLHFPSSFKDAENARLRLAFNELFFLQFYLSLSKKSTHILSKKKNHDTLYRNAFIETLPFQLTADQSKVLSEIEEDLISTFPMTRLLQGDVGSGKTVVAAGAAYCAVKNSRQVAVMAPTEILAQQLYKSLQNFLDDAIKIDILTGKITKKKREVLLENINNNTTNIIIGTHALIQDDVVFNNLGLVIIDEQHRFGTEQRSILRLKGDDTDLLVMTATPIPRSLSMTVFGDLDLSIIKEKPANRGSITTLAFPQSRITGVYNSMKKYIDQGRQIYFVLPLIEESSALDLKSAQKAFEEISLFFKDSKVSLLHGRMKNEEKTDVMNNFHQNNIDILVTTTVIEVGIDEANATVIVIEDAWRFGLSQLHQLRGRVGRSSLDSFCIMMYPDDLEEDSLKRINIMNSTDDGFLIAEEDLKLRGAGQLIGTKQHGFNGDFEFVDLVNDVELIINAKKEAQKAADEIKDINFYINDPQSLERIPVLRGLRSKRILSILS